MMEQAQPDRLSHGDAKSLADRFTLTELLVACHPEFREARRRTIRFTLTELLVVIAIIIVLISLLLPAFKTAQITANGATCRNNMRSIGLSISAYTNDYNGCFWGGNSLPLSEPPNLVVLTCWAVRLYNTGYSPLVGRAHGMGPPPGYDCAPSWVCPEYRRFYGLALSEHGIYEGTQVFLKWNGTESNDYKEDEPANWFNMTKLSKRCIVMELKGLRHHQQGGPMWPAFQLLKISWNVGFDFTPDLAVDPSAVGNGDAPGVSPAIHFGKPNFLYADFHVGNLSRSEYWGCYTRNKGGGPLFFPWDF